MTILNWTRTQDGEHNGRPCYDYTATHGGLKFFITWASDAGFGYSISFATNKALADNHLPPLSMEDARLIAAEFPDILKGI